MKIIEGKEQAYADYKAKNTQDPYSAGVVGYTEKWAELMEERIAKGEKVADIYKETSSEADKSFGITGFMYGCAVSALVAFWPHGEELRRPHNKEHGREDANEKEGAVANPAVIEISIKD